MTPPIPDRIRSKAIRQTVGLMRYEAKLQADILEMLDTLGADLVRGLLGAGLDTPRTDWQRARLQAMLKEIKSTIQTAFHGIESHHADEMAGLIKVSGKGIVTAINEAIGASLLIPPKWTMEELRAIASNVLIEGAPSSAWWTRQADGVLEDFADAMRKGMLRGETVTQLRDRIMGQDIRGVNGIGKIDLRTVPIADRAVIKTARRNAEALVRTSVISTANTAHLEAFRANDDIMGGVEWCSTLDSRTTVICMHLDGLRWGLDGKPLGHSTPFPGATAHWGCRSSQVGATKSWEDLAREAGGDTNLARKLDSIPAGDRASMGGPVSGNLRYADWFEEQPEAFQRATLGPGKYDLWRRGKIGFSDMVDQRGNPLTLKELEEAFG